MLTVITVTNQMITSSVMFTLASRSDVSQYHQLHISPQLTLSRDAQPRMYHTATALSLGPGRIQVTMFGGCPKWEWGKSEDAQQKLAKTTVLDFGE